MIADPKPAAVRRSSTVLPTFLLSVLFSVVLLGGCAAIGLDRRATADAIATQAGMTPVSFDTGAFVLQGYWRGLNQPGDRLVVYIEGDGYAWVNKTRISPDPTPRTPVTLELAAADPTAKVLYLARPCQYVTPATARTCGPRYWSTHRFAPETIAALDTAVDQAKARLQATTLTLIGYSGGGVAAALLAEQRTDVTVLATVASPLDTDAWTRFHEVTPLYGSLTPVDHADRLTRLPQIHFAGSNDTVVPPDILRSFLTRLGPDNARRLVMVPGADHGCCWARDWAELRQQLPTP